MASSSFGLGLFDDAFVVMASGFESIVPTGFLWPTFVLKRLLLVLFICCSLEIGGNTEIRKLKKI